MFKCITSPILNKLTCSRKQCKEHKIRQSSEMVKIYQWGSCTSCFEETQFLMSISAWLIMKAIDWPYYHPEICSSLMQACQTVRIMAIIHRLPAKEWDLYLNHHILGTRISAFLELDLHFTHQGSCFWTLFCSAWSQWNGFSRRTGPWSLLL